MRSAQEQARHQDFPLNQKLKFFCSKNASLGRHAEQTAGCVTIATGVNLLVRHYTLTSENLTKTNNENRDYRSLLIKPCCKQVLYYCQWDSDTPATA